MNILLARIAPARILSDDDAHRLTVSNEECRWVAVADDDFGRGFLASCWNLGYAVINLGEISPGWGAVGPMQYGFGYTVPYWEDADLILL